MTAPDVSLDELAETVTAFLASLSPCGRFITSGTPSAPAVRDALAALLARAKEAERRDAIRTENWEAFRKDWQRRADKERERAEAAEAKLAEAEKALPVWIDSLSTVHPNWLWMVNEMKAALASIRSDSGQGGER